MEKEYEMRKLVELARELERQKQSKKDFIVPSEQIRTMYDIGKKTIRLSLPTANNDPHDVELFGITDTCHDQLAQKTKIPTQFYRRLKEDHPELLVRNINELIQEKDKRLVRVLDGNVRALLSDRYRIIDNYDVLFNAMDQFKTLNTENDARIFVKRADLSETRLYVKAISDRLKDTIFTNKEKPEVGDMVEGGIIIMNSEVGAGAYKVMPFMNVLKCQNGMISEESFTKVHLGRSKSIGQIDWSDETLSLEDAALWSKISDMIKGTFDPEIFMKWVDRINDKASTVIEKPILAVNNVVKNYDLPKSKAEELLSQFSQEGFTQWGLCNAVTAVAKNETNYDRQIELEKLGTRLMEVEVEELQ